MLLKATQSLPHEGGEVFSRDSDAYRVLVRWIGSGLVYRSGDEPALTRVEVLPRERRYLKGAGALCGRVGAGCDVALGFFFE